MAKIMRSAFALLSLRIYRQTIPDRWLETVESSLVSKLKKIRDYIDSSVYEIKVSKGDAKEFLRVLQRPRTQYLLGQRLEEIEMRSSKRALRKTRAK